MKTRIIEALALMTQIQDAGGVRLGGQDEIRFTQAKQELQKALDMPEVEPAEIVRIEVGTETMAALVTAKLSETFSEIRAKNEALERELHDGKIKSMESMGQVFKEVFVKIEAVEVKVDGLDAALSGLSSALSSEAEKVAA